MFNSMASIFKIRKKELLGKNISLQVSDTTGNDEKQFKENSTTNHEAVRIITFQERGLMKLYAARGKLD